MNAPLNPSTMTPYNTTQNPTVWSDYDGDDIYGDYRVTAGTPPTVEQLNAYQPGLWRQVGLYKRYLHNDHLGTLRLTTSVAGPEETLRVFTAFGERHPASPTDRFGYVGAWGYQSHSEMPFLHVGARYYDPASGRFLQRDPIGILGGTNVYAYAFNNPLIGIDPAGEWVGSLIGGIVGGIVGAVTGGISGGVTGAIAGAVGGAVSGALIGSGVPPPVAGAIGGAVSGAISGGSGGGGVAGAAAGALAVAQQVR